MSQNHRMVEAGSNFWRSSGPIPHCWSRDMYTHLPGTMSDGFRISPRMETPQIPWATCASDWSPSQEIYLSWCSERNFCVLVLPLILSLGTTEESLAPSSLHSPFSYLYTLIKRPLSLLFSYSEESQLFQLFLICQLLQSLRHLCGPFLGSLQHVHVSLVLASPELDTAPQVWPHQCWVEGKDHLPRPAGYAFFNAAQDAIHLLCSKGTLLPHVQLVVHQDTQVLFCKAAFQLGDPQSILVLMVQDFPLLHVGHHEVPVSPFLQPVDVCLHGSTTLWCISHSCQFGVICRLAEGTLCPVIQIVNDIVKDP